MSDSFDAYYKWLSIPPDEQPPNHYRLLGVKAFECDADVIAGAADRQMVHVRSFQGGKHAAVSQRLLNELSAARVCLLSPGAKAAYDQELRLALGAKLPARAGAGKPMQVAKALPSSAAVVGANGGLGFDPLADGNAPRPRKKRSAARLSPPRLAVTGLLLAAIIGAGWLLFARSRDENTLAGHASGGNSSGPRQSDLVRGDGDGEVGTPNSSFPEADPGSARAPSASRQLVTSLASADEEAGDHGAELSPAEDRDDSSATGAAEMPADGEENDSGLRGKNSANGLTNEPPDTRNDAPRAVDPPAHNEIDGTKQAPSIDLLALVDPDRQQLQDTWTRTPAGLRGEKIFTSIGVPLAVVGDYSLHVEFTRLSGNDSVNVIIPIGSKQCLLALSAWQGQASGLQKIDGKDERENSTGVRPGTLENNHRYRVDFTVHLLRELASIEVKLDGKPFAQWKGRIDSLSLEGGWGVPGTDNIGFGVCQPTVFHVAQLQWLNRPPEKTANVAGKKPARAKKSSQTGPALKREVYLSDLKPSALHLWENSTLNHVPVVVGGIASPHGLFTHPDQSAHVVYELPAGYRALAGQVAINDTADGPQGAHSPVTFRIVADGKELWRSRAAQGRNDPQDFFVSIVVAKKLELFVDCAGDWGKAHAVWIEPKLLKRSK